MGFSLERARVMVNYINFIIKRKDSHYLEKANKGVNISELVKIIGLKQPTVTFHVNKLAKVNLIKKKKSGRVTFCSISPRCNNCLLIKN